MLYLLDSLLKIYGYIIIVRVIISWVNPDPYNPLIRLIHGLTDPVLEPIRRLLPDMGGLDISPFVAILIIWIFDDTGSRTTRGLSLVALLLLIIWILMSLI